MSFRKEQSHKLISPYHKHHIHVDRSTQMNIQETQFNYCSAKRNYFKKN